MSEYTPTTEQMRDLYVLADPAGYKSRREYVAEFDRWLNEVRADAWEAGRIDGQINAENEGAIAYGTRKEITNPYRQEQDA